MKNSESKPLLMFRMTDDGSVPINLGDQTIEDPIYGVDKKYISKNCALSFIPQWM